MNFVDGCPECKGFSGRYEAATIEWFRLQGQLGIAEHLRDPKVSADIVAELTRIAKSRQSIREAAERHIDSAHARRLANGG